MDSWYLGFSSVFWVDPVLFGALFDVFCGLRWVFVGFSLVVNINGCGLWVLEKIRRVSYRFRGNFLVSVVFSSDSVLVWRVFDVFWGLRCVLVGFLLVTMVKKCKLWVLENIRKVYGDFWGGSMAFGFFFRFWV